ncbi:hypothetical protein MKW98_004543, partial [Papaver atlanticum]
DGPVCWRMEAQFTRLRVQKANVIKICPVSSVHNPQFYWKIATQADLGLGDAYINALKV